MTQPPGTGTLAEQFNDLKRQIEELSRKSPANPACRISLNANVNLAVTTDTLAQGGWGVREDPLGWYTPGGAAPCYITIPFTGYYLVNYHCACTGAASGQVAACKVQVNNTSVGANTSIATDGASFPSTGSDGAVLNAYRARFKLFAGDKLYWSNWVSAAATLLSSSFGVPTEMTVQFVSSR